MIFKNSFRLKLIFSYVLVVVFSFTFVAFSLDRKLEENSLRNIKTFLVSQAYLVSSQIDAKNIKKENTASLEVSVMSLRQKIESRITVLNNRGRVLADSEKAQEEISRMENHFDRPEIKTAFSGGVGMDTRYSSTLKIDMLYVALPLEDNHEIVGIVRLALPLKNVQGMLNEIRKIILAGLCFALGLAFVLGLIISARIIKPINRVIRISRKFSEGDFSGRIIKISKDEIGELGVALNKMAQDIEDKIKEVKQHNQELSAVLNSMIEGVIVLDKRGYIVSVNLTVERIFGIVRKEAEGKTFLEVARNNDLSEIINSALKKGALISGEITLVYPVRKTFQVNAVPLFDNNEINGCLAVIHDITEIRKLETIRRDFVANVSHELKTPLTSIKGFVETLLEGALDDKDNNRNFLKIIQDHTERLNKLVNDLLSLSHLESKEITLNKSNLNLRQQLEDVILGFKSQWKKMNLEISNDLPASIMVNADKDKIEQVFTNLIDNAIKFNKEKGAIRIYAQEVNGKIKVFVEDSGIGIPPQDIPRIFERFYRVDKARSHELGGTGLGLSIVKHIVELHGGSVGVESSEGFGSKFWFILPK